MRALHQALDCIIGLFGVSRTLKEVEMYFHFRLFFSPLYFILSRMFVESSRVKKGIMENRKQAYKLLVKFLFCYNDSFNELSRNFCTKVLSIVTQI